MQWIYLSPHFDDVALSCGGLVWEQTNSEDSVSIWTICAGDPPEGEFSSFAQKLHERWGTGAHAMAQRRQEDIESCLILSAAYYHFGIPDCIYRRLEPINGDTRQGEQINNKFLITSEEDLYGEPHPLEILLIRRLCEDLKDSFPNHANIVAPFGFGKHVDHLLTRYAAEETGRNLWFYQDYPYILGNLDQLSEMESSGWKRKLFKISEEATQAWMESVLAHRSQRSTFWTDDEAVEESIHYYLGLSGGICLWKKLK